jgi:hypothetical protein
VPTHHFHVWPYVECRAPGEDWPPCPAGLEDDWDALLNDGRMGWSIGRGDPRSIIVGGRRVWQFCGLPREQRPGVPRAGMYHQFDNYERMYPLFFDWSMADPAAEVEWFRTAFAPELDLLRKVFGESLWLCWGLVYWPY